MVEGRVGDKLVLLRLQLFLLGFLTMASWRGPDLTSFREAFKLKRERPTFWMNFIVALKKVRVLQLIFRWVSISRAYPEGRREI